MPRPQTKEALISASQKEHDALESFLDTLTSEQMLQPGIVGEWSVKDVLAHLYEWEQCVYLNNKNIVAPVDSTVRYGNTL